MDATVDNAMPSSGAPRQTATKIRRIYGRKKEEFNILHPSGTGEDKSSSRQEPLAVVINDLKKSPSSSSVQNEATEDAFEVSFGWKKRMADIDRMFDEEATDMKSAMSSSGGVYRKSSSSESASTDSSLSRLDDSLLFGPLPPFTSSQTDLSTPPTTSYKNSKRESSRQKSDFDAEEITKDKESSPTSPLHPHPITTPDTKSSPTPPSSDEEDELPGPSNLLSSEQNSEKGLQAPCRPKSKGKRKADDSNHRNQTKKLKKLNKKEEKESKKAHARIMNDQRVSVSKISDQLTINDLLGKIRQSNNVHAKPLARLNHATSSDPIQDFTSSPSLLQTTAVPSAEFDTGPVSLLHLDNEDDELPDIQSVLREEEEKKHRKETDEKRRKELALAKQRILARANKSYDSGDESDDDLEVVNERHEQRRSGKVFDYEKKLAGVVGFQANGGRQLLPDNLEGSQGDRTLKAAARPVFMNRRSQRTSAAVDHKALQAAMLSKASKQSAQLTREKEEEWVRRGGRLSRKQRTARANKGFTLKTLAENLAQKTGAESVTLDSTDNESHSGYDSGADWKPSALERQLASRSEDASGGEEEFSGTEIHDENRLVSHEQVEENDENVPNIPRRVSHLPKRQVLSDSEDEENNRPAPPRILVPDTSMILGTDEYIREQALAHRGSVSSMCESIPDEENKENDTRLMFDHGEDKENLSVPRHVPIAGSSRGLGVQRSSISIFNLEEQAQCLSVSPINASVDLDKKERWPLQAHTCSGLDDPFMLQSPTISNRGTPKRSPKQLRLSVSPKVLAPAFSGPAGGLSQLFNDEDGIIPRTQGSAQKGFLQPAFQIRSKFVDSPTQPSLEPKPIDPGGFSQLFSPESAVNEKASFKCPRDVKELSLTLDTRLQPAIAVSTQVRRKADAIFEKEQGFVLEEATIAQAQHQQKFELYVTESGMLTQTKPDGSTPVVYRAWSPTQGTTQPPSTSQRIPLRTLSLISEALSPQEPRRLSRLVKGKGRSYPSGSDEGEGEVFALPQSRNAFIKLLKGAQKEQTKKHMQRSEFVEGEAEESDEDEMFGFGGSKKEDDEDSDSDDPDANVEGLLDDAAFDDEQLGEDKIVQKVQEQNEDDDAALQKYHQDAVDGKFRTKKRGNGIVLDDSDSDPDDDEDARRIRQRMYKKRRVDDDQLEALSNDPKSRAFLDAYKRDVVEADNEDFAHLARDDMDSEDDEKEQAKTVSTTEIQAQLREAARQKIVKPSCPFDPEDVRWTASMTYSDDEDLGVEEIDIRPHKNITKRPTGDFADLDLLPKESSNWNNEQLAAWKREQSGRNLGTGGMRGAITVTGHGPKSERSSMARTSRFTAEERSGGRKVTKTGSMLMRVSDKQSRFG